MAGSSGKQTGILGRLRDRRDTRRAEKARVRGEAMRERERKAVAAELADAALVVRDLSE